MITQFPAFQKYFYTELQVISFEISLFPAISIFFHLVFVKSVHFDLAQVVFFFYQTTTILA